MRYAAILLICCSSTFAYVTGNFNGDCTVDFKDFAILSSHWLTSGTGDLDASGTVDFNDLNIFISHWLESEPAAAAAAAAAAANPDPTDNATAVPTNKVLSWTMANVDCETTLADVWFGPTGDMVLVSENQAASTYTPSLTSSTEYKWRIDTKNSQGTTTGTVWTFHTAASAAPVASDQTVSTNTYIVTPITLSATDDGWPNPPGKIRYDITALPADVNAYVQDPVSGGQNKITSSHLPYKLSSWGKTVWFATSTVGTTTFKFKAWDGEQYSTEKTVTVNVSANAKDCLSFDGQGYVTVPDTRDFFDLVDGRGISLFIKTRIPYGKVLSKYTAGAAGYELWLVGGVPQVRLFDASGLVATVHSPKRVDNGAWHCFGFCYDVDGAASWLQIYDANETDFSSGSYIASTYTSWISVPQITYSNSSSFIFGSTYKKEIDNVRAYALTSYIDNYYNYAGFSCNTRTAAGTVNSWGGITLCPAAVVRFHCNYDGTNNTTTQVYDDISATHLIGAFSSSDHVRYYPFFWHWYDSSFQQVR